MKLSPVSMIIGALLATGVLLSTASGPASSTPRIEYGPHPRDMVQVRDGTPYVVPSGKTLVVTALGGMSSGAVYGGASLTIDGTPAYRADFTFSSVSMCSMPVGFTVAARATLEVHGVNGAGRAWGYLADDLSGVPGVPPFFRMQYSPHPRDMISINEAQPYTVPLGKVLTVTGLWSRLGAAGSSNPVVLAFNGTPEFVARQHDNYTDDAGTVPMGLTFHPGDVVSVAGGIVSADDSVVLGYLANM